MITAKISSAGVTNQNVRPMVEQCTASKQFVDDLRLDFRDASGEHFDGEIPSLAKWLKSGGTVAVKTSQDSEGLVVSLGDLDLQPKATLAKKKLFFKGFGRQTDGSETLTILSDKPRPGGSSSQDAVSYKLEHLPHNNKWKREIYTIVVSQNSESEASLDRRSVSKTWKRAENGLTCASSWTDSEHGVRNELYSQPGRPTFEIESIDFVHEPWGDTFRWTTRFDGDGENHVDAKFSEQEFELWDSGPPSDPARKCKTVEFMAGQLEISEAGFQALGEPFYRSA